MENNIENIIVRYLSKEATPIESNLLEKWLQESPDNRNIFIQKQNIWRATHLPFTVTDKEVEIAKNKILPTKKSTTKRFIKFFQQAAAILFIPLLFGFSYYLIKDSSIKKTKTIDAMQKIFAPYGTYTKVQLSDSTIVWLNAGSTLTYPTAFKEKNRIVKLEGEAFFEVESDKAHPFIVQTATTEVTATGTQFNVESYAADSITAVTMIKGIIQVKYGNSTPFILPPGERVRYNKITKEIQPIQRDTEKYIAWKDGIMMFRDDPLSEVFKCLERTYHVKIQIKNQQVSNYKYRATFKGESLDEILRLLKMSAPIQYKESREIAPNGLEIRHIDVLAQK